MYLILFFQLFIPSLVTLRILNILVFKYVLDLLYYFLSILNPSFDYWFCELSFLEISFLMCFGILDSRLLLSGRFFLSVYVVCACVCVRAHVHTHVYPFLSNDFSAAVTQNPEASHSELEQIIVGWVPCPTNIRNVADPVPRPASSLA